MKYVILKELLPSLVGTEGYNEELNFIEKCTCIDNDESFIFNTLIEAEAKKSNLAILFNKNLRRIFFI